MSNILDQPESLRGPLVGSLALHVSVFAALIWYSVLSGRREYWGDRNPGGGSSMMSQRRAPDPSASQRRRRQSGRERHPVRSARTQAGAREEGHRQGTGAGRHSASQPHRAEETVPQAASINTYRAKQIDRPNQLYSQEGQALVTPLIGQPGSGGIGVGRGSPFGDRYRLLRRYLAAEGRSEVAHRRCRSAHSHPRRPPS